MTPDLNEAKKFIKALTGSADTPVTFQWFHDSLENRPDLAGHISGKVDEHAEMLTRLNREGCGIFLMVNAGDLNGRSTKNVTAIRALFYDSDKGPLKVNSPLKPSVINDSKHGPHGYFILNAPSADLYRFKPLQKAISAKLGTDSGVCDLPRVMRLPGTYNMKDPANPHLLRILEVNPVRYTLEEVESAFGVSSSGVASNAASPTETHSSGVDLFTEKRAKDYLAGLEVATTGSIKTKCYEAACKLKDWIPDRLAVIKLISTDFKSEPALDLEGIEYQVNCAFKYGQNAPGIDAPELVFAPISTTPEAEPPPKRDVIGELNTEFFISHENGKAFIFKEYFDAVLKRRTLQYFTPADFRMLRSNDWVERGKKEDGTPKLITAATAWIESPYRRQYLGGCVFDPSKKNRPDTYNLFRGLNVEAKEGDWELIREFLQTVICNSDPALFQYLLGWLANMFQNPGEPGQVALVLKGFKGIGKSKFAEILLHIMGQHGFVVNQTEQLVGRFQLHLRDAVCVIAEESFWAGDRPSEGKLRALITNKLIPFEGKGLKVIIAANVMHIIFITNDKWAVPASLKDERRFSIFDVSDKHIRDRPYFGAVHKQAFELGGAEAMLYYLLNYDLKNFDVTDFPNNAGLTDQKLRSLRGVDRWLYEALNSCILRTEERREKGAPDERIHDWGDRQVTVPKESLYKGYERWSRQREHSPTEYSQWVRIIVREHLPDLVEAARVKGVNGDRNQVLRLESIVKCREAFATKNNLVGIEWSETPTTAAEYAAEEAADKRAANEAEKKAEAERKKAWERATAEQKLWDAELKTTPGKNGNDLFAPNAPGGEVIDDIL